ncbi:hypothetical protein AGMMS50262_04750 [Bacteroidia bacterium]|nr:hypothetical protein AGMMS50262_04750 [Bacteroidia bacterium]
MILFDTNIFIEILRNNLRICEIVDTINRSDVALSDIVRIELFYGSFNKAELKEIEKGLADLHILPVQPQISEIAVDLVKQYCLSHKLNLPDAYIAATALYHDIELFTLNLKDFSYISNLKFYQL